jgi:xanthine dehydrogenase large subunit
MGQGLFTKVAQVVAEELSIDVDRIRVTASDTSKVPNASATAASSGSDINGKAAQAAARSLRERLAMFAADEVPVDDVHSQTTPSCSASGRFRSPNWCVFLFRARVAVGHRVLQTPKIGYDRKTWSGNPFYYFCYGGRVGSRRRYADRREPPAARRHPDDVGRSLNPAIDMGQIEGGFIQGMGWLTMEHLWWNDKGKLMTHAPSTYKIPVANDVPPVFNVKIWESGANAEDSIYRSKAVGEPPLMLAISVHQAIKDAIASVADYRSSQQLDTPATPEEILHSVEELEDVG